MEHLITDGNGHAQPKIKTPIEGAEYLRFIKEHPSLPCFTADGKEFREKGEFIGEKGWMYEDGNSGQWLLYDGEPTFAMHAKYNIRPCYIIHPPVAQEPVQAEPLYTEAEVKEIVLAYIKSPGSFDKWWEVTNLNKANR